MPDVYETNLPSLKLIRRGKVRDIYELDANRMLIVATDRLSAFDVVLPTPITDKGKILTAMTRYWLRTLEVCAPHHLLPDNPMQGRSREEQEILEDRSMVVKRLVPLPVEMVVRGYLAGSGWRDYESTGKICGIALPPNLKPGHPLPQPLLTPATKAPDGSHDENITFAEMEKRVGGVLATKASIRAIQIYKAAAIYALKKGIIIADTKFEFGVDSKGEVHLMDEVLTPDSSRFWLTQEYSPGEMPAGLDKQYVRNYLDQSDWKYQAPGPKLPDEVVNNTRQRYYQAYEILTGDPLPFKKAP